MIRIFAYIVSAFLLDIVRRTRMKSNRAQEGRSEGGVLTHGIFS
jgi:hypothetical protein